MGFENWTSNRLEAFLQQLMVPIVWDIRYFEKVVLFTSHARCRSSTIQFVKRQNSFNPEPKGKVVYTTVCVCHGKRVQGANCRWHFA